MTLRGSIVFRIENFKTIIVKRFVAAEEQSSYNDLECRGGSDLKQVNTTVDTHYLFLVQ